MADALVVVLLGSLLGWNLFLLGCPRALGALGRIGRRMRTWRLFPQTCFRLPPWCLTDVFGHVVFFVFFVGFFN